MRTASLSTILALTVLALAIVAPVVKADGETAAHFSCQLCRDAMTELLQAKSPQEHPPQTWGKLRATIRASQYCDDARSGIFNPCDVVMPALDGLLSTATPAEDKALRGASPREACVRLGLCDSELIFNRPDLTTTVAEPKLGEPAIHDLRVALAHGSRGYDFVRISYIDNVARNHSAAFFDFFQYNEKFRYVWTEKWLHTAIVPISPSGPTTFSIGVDFNVTVRLPAKGKGVRGLLVADPCFSGEFVGCRFGKKFDIFNRLTHLLNVALTKDVDMWAIIGDNFYDAGGVLTPKFMEALTLEAKSQPVVAIPGNHDFWQHGSPKAKTGFDTYGNGYMQYWMMDTQQAAKNNSMPFDFAVDPSTKEIANVNNFFTYNLIGNLATITFSGAHEMDVSDALFQEACRWVADVKPAYVFVLGHWSGESLGCAKGMDTRKVHGRIIKMDGCKEIAHRIKWFEGHQHCNFIVEKNVGFRVGAFGLGGCGQHTTPNFGIPYFEIGDAGDLTVGYFPIYGGNGTVPEKEEGHACAQIVPWDTLMDCISSKGLAGCKHLGVIWHKQALDDHLGA